MPKPTRNVYSIKTTYYHGRRTLRYCEAKDEVAKFNRAADKTLLQRLFNMSCLPPPTLAGFGCLTLQKYNFFPNWTKKSPLPPKFRQKAIKLF